MPVLLSSSFNTGDGAYGTGSMHPRAKVVELRWFPEDLEHVRLTVEVGDTLSGSWVRGDDTPVFNFSITGSDYWI